MVSRPFSFINNRRGRQTVVRTLLGSFLIWVSASCAFAGDGLFGTKTSPISATTTTTGSGMGAMPIAQMFVALLVVLALLKWLMPTLIKKAGRRVGASTSGIKVQETVVIGPANLYVVEVRGKSFLLGATANSVSCIADLSANPQPQLQTFQEMVDAAPDRLPYTDPSISDALEQLNRLKHFGA